MTARTGCTLALLGALIGVPAVLASPPPAAAASFSGCNGVLGRSVRAAYDNVKANIGRLKKADLGPRRAVRRRVRRRMDRTIGKLKISCEGGFKCRKHAGGRATPLVSRRIRVCVDNIAKKYGAPARVPVCALAEIIAHEFAHTVGIPSDLGHNNGPNRDRVYRFGSYARQLCERRKG